MPGTNIQGIPWHTETMMHGNDNAQYDVHRRFEGEQGYFSKVLQTKGPFFGVQGKFSYINLGLDYNLWSTSFIEIDLGKVISHTKSCI